jgi:hypothetical protein
MTAARDPIPAPGPATSACVRLLTSADPTRYVMPARIARHWPWVYVARGSERPPQGKDGSSVAVIGLAVFVVAAVFGIDLVDKNRYKIPSLHVFGENIGLGGSGRLYVLGVITGAALMLGLLLFLAGLRRKSSQATARRRQRKEATALEREVESLRAERAGWRERQFDGQGNQIGTQGNRIDRGDGTGSRESDASAEAPTQGAPARADT